MLLLTLWRDGSLWISLLAAIAGIGLLFLPWFLKQKEDLEPTERTLLLMSFSYWAVHCIAILIQKLPLPASDVLLMSLKMTAIITYFLTFACVLSLPLNRFAISHQLEEE